jgi:hypothetical protein
MLLLTFLVFGGVMIFATVVYPGGIREALARTQIFHFDGGENGENVTSSGRLKDLILDRLLSNWHTYKSFIWTASKSLYRSSPGRCLQ